MRATAAGLFFFLVFAGCATVRGGPQALASIDVRDVDGAPHTLAAHAGKVVAVCVCATWAEACHLNGRAFDQAAQALPAADIALVTLLLDDLPAPLMQTAMRDYLVISGQQTPVVVAGPRVRAGHSVLGEVSGVPRLVVFDRQGRVVLDESGGVLSAEGLVNRLQPLL
jgi:hypothetical protein